MDEIGIYRDLLRMASQSKEALTEHWQNEIGISAARWGTTITGAGGAARSVAEPPYLKVVLTGPVNADTARLYGLQRWYCAPDEDDANYLKEAIIRAAFLEFEAKFDTVASILNTAFFMGFGDTQAVTEASNNIIGFVLDASDDLIAICNDGAGPTVSAAIATAAEIASWHKYRIEVKLPELINFYIDGEFQAVIAANLPNYAMYPNWYLQQEPAANGGELHIGSIRIWFDYILREASRVG